jgi:hypothetical protein
MASSTSCAGSSFSSAPSTGTNRPSASRSTSTILMAASSPRSSATNSVVLTEYSRSPPSSCADETR